MRTLDFWLDRTNGVCVQGLKSSSPVNSITIVRNDTIRFRLHSLEKNTAVPALTTYVETGLGFNSARTSIGLIDTMPASGSFAFKVGDQTTLQLNWPADLSTQALVTAWKTAMLDALLALSNVGEFDGHPALTLTDPATAPAHFNYFTWADPARVDPITVVNNRLLPLCLPKPIPANTPDGYTQLIKFRQAPVAMCTAFANPLPPVCTIEETVLGKVGTNEEQTLIVPDGAAGGISFGWNGATTATLDVTTITDAAIATALNAIVANGDTNPSFTVNAMTASAGQRFAIGFAGPLAGAPQTEIAVNMVDQVPELYAEGVLDLSASDLPVEEELDGQQNATLALEIVLDTPGEETYLLGVVVDADMTDSSTSADIAASGAVLTVTNTVYVNDANPTPMVQAAPGILSAPTAAGASFNFAHGLNTWQPFVRVSRQLTADPEVWEQVPDTEFTAESTDANSVTVAFVTWVLNAIPGDPFNFANFKVFVWSPNTELLLYNLNLTWDQILSAVPGGMTVRQKFAALDAALGIFNGNLKINASNITGQIDSDQIDLAGLGSALANVGSFVSTFQQLASNSQFLTNLFNAAQTNPAFVAALTSVVSNSSNASLISALIAALLANGSFSAAINTAVTDALQDGSQLPSGVTTLFEIPNLTDLYPSPRNAPTSQTPASTVTQTSGSNSGTSSTQTTTTQANPAATVQTLPVYAPLPKAVVVPIDKGTVNGELPLASFQNVNWKYLVQGSATAHTRGRSQGQVFRDGTIVVSDGKQWYAAFADASGTLYPISMRRELFTLAVRAEQLWAGTRFSTTFGLSLALLGDVTGEYLLRVRTGTAAQAAGGGANLSQVNWDAPVIEERIILSNVTTIHAFGFAVTNTAGALTASKTLYGKSSDAQAPATANFVLKAALDCFDVSGREPNPCGAVSLIMTNARASIVMEGN